MGDPNRQLPGPRWDAHDRGEQTTGDTVVSAREEFERVETNGGESERPIVSLKRGNHPRDPAERRGRHVRDFSLIPTGFSSSPTVIQKDFHLLDQHEVIQG
jgi:hypothetical protein